jgi:pimeloyl-ACP methyl ester carboxylesterase
MRPITHSRIATNGIELHVAEQGTGPLVVLLHGFPEGWHSYRHQLPFLAAAGFRVVAPDQRGYGDSDRPEAIEAYDQVTLAADVAGLIEALGEQQAVVVGHDWGAAVAWNTALLHPGRVRAVAGMSVPFSARPPMSPLAFLRAYFKDRFFYILYFQTPGVAEAELEADVRRSLRMMFYSLSGDAPPGSAFRPQAAVAPGSAGALLPTLIDPPRLPPWLSEAELDEYAAPFARHGFRAPLNWYRNIDRSWRLTAHLTGAKIEQPALFVAGAQDAVLAWNPGALEAMPPLMPNLRATVIVPGAGHWIQQERPDQVNAALLEFVSGL